jgi:hypothetical protein
MLVSKLCATVHAAIYVLLCTNSDWRPLHFLLLLLLHYFASASAQAAAAAAAAVFLTNARSS